MTPVYKAKAKLFIGVGVILCFFVAPQMGRHPITFWTLAVGGAAVFVYGCCCLVQAKGYPWAFGFLGLLSLAGLVILLLFPDRRPQDSADGFSGTFPPGAPAPPRSGDA